MAEKISHCCYIIAYWGYITHNYAAWLYINKIGITMLKEELQNKVREANERLEHLRGFL